MSSFIAMGSPSRMLLPLSEGEIGRASYTQIFDRFYPERGDHSPFTLTPEEFLALPKISAMQREDQVRWWILLSYMYKLNLLYGTNELRWNRHHTLATAINFGLPEGRCRIDVGTGKMSDGVTEHAYDANVLLNRLLKSDDPSSVDQEIAHVASLCKSISGDRVWEGCCTGKVWKQIFDRHGESIRSVIPELRPFSPEEEREYEFGKCSPAFHEQWTKLGHDPLPDPSGVFTFGGSTGAIQIFADGKTNEIPIGSKSPIFKDGLPTLSHMIDKVLHV